MARSFKPFNLQNFAIANLGNSHNASWQLVPIIPLRQRPRVLGELFQIPCSPAPGPWPIGLFSHKDPFYPFFTGKTWVSDPTHKTQMQCSDFLPEISSISPDFVGYPPYSHTRIRAVWGNSHTSMSLTTRQAGDL